MKNFKQFLGNKKFFIITGLTPLYFILIGLTLFPFFMNIYMSFVDYYLVSETKGQFVFFQNYSKLLLDKSFWKILGNTFYFSIGAVSIELGLGIAISLALNSLKNKARFIRTIIILPMAAAPIAVAYGWTLIMEPSIGIFNYFLSFIGVSKQLWFSSPYMVIPTFMIIDAWQWTPFIIIILTGSMLALPKEPFEAAMVDGASPFQMAKFITLPLLKPTIIFAVVLRFIDAFKIFDTIYAITKGGPGNHSETLSIKTFNLGFHRLRMGEAASLSIIILIILFLIFQFLIKRSRVFTEE